jgi:pimeloyl-ACP methyl ester carboxylesterase
MATVRAGRIAVVAGGVAAGLAVLARVGYRRDIQRARERISTGSEVALTPCGPIEFALAGEGSPVLVVHGAGGGFDQGMDIALPLLSRGFRIIAPSRFGYLHTPLPADASPEAQADAHACLLDTLAIPRVAVVAASAGAPSAIQFVLRHPYRCRALVLLVPATYVPRAGGAPSLHAPARTRFLFDTALKSDFLFWALIKYGRTLAIRGMLATPPAIVANATAEEKARIDRFLANILPVGSRRSGLINDAAITSSLVRYSLKRIGVPTLVISVRDDLFSTWDGARYTAEHIPRARFVGYASGGHLCVGHQDEVGVEIASFLQ